ncbi:MAG: DoxX family protein [Actinomycetota bacterium]
MGVLAWITGVLLIVGFGLAGVSKVTKQQQMVDAAGHMGMSVQQFQMIGGLEIAGAVGVLIGLVSEDLRGLGIAAAIGLALVGIGAVVFHVRAGDKPPAFAPAAVLTIVAVLAVVGLAGM